MVLSPYINGMRSAIRLDRRLDIILMIAFILGTSLGGQLWPLPARIVSYRLAIVRSTVVFVLRLCLMSDQRGDWLVHVDILDLILLRPVDSIA